MAQGEDGVGVGPVRFLQCVAKTWKQSWLAIVTVIPIEAEASIQYMSSWPFAWSHALYQNGQLTWPALVSRTVRFTFAPA